VRHSSPPRPAPRNAVSTAPAPRRPGRPDDGHDGMSTERPSLEELEAASVSVLDRVRAAAAALSVGGGTPTDLPEIAASVRAIDEQLRLDGRASGPSTSLALARILARVEASSALLAELVDDTDLDGVPSGTDAADGS
jgi:hypothetical protein